MPSSGWRAMLVKCSHGQGRLPVVLGLVRILICFWPQTGCLHPDEFFQSADIYAGQHFDIKTDPVWEFRTDRPIRCMLFPNILNWLAFTLARFIQQVPSAYILIVTPRLIYTLASFSIDYCLYRLCQSYSQKGLWYLPISVIFQSSFICLGVLTRTLSNTIEAILFGWLLAIVCRIVRPTFRILMVTPTSSKPINQRISKSAQYTSSMLVGALLVLGTFNRPTFPCFALVPCMYWLRESLRRNSNQIGRTIQWAILPLILSSFLTFATISCYDTIYYRDFEIVKDMFYDLIEFEYEDFYSKLRESWIVTPYNFLLFNTDVNNLSKYGVHKPYIHALVNLPLAFNLLAIMFYKKLTTLLVEPRGQVYRLLFTTHRIHTMLLLVTVAATFALSLIPHQEFRFLAPLVIPLVYSHASDIYTNKKLLRLWFAINLILLYFYARIHQSGITNAVLDLDLILKDFKQQQGENFSVSVIASKCYPVPTYAWNIDKHDDRFYLNLADTITNDFEGNVNDKLGPALGRLEADLNSTMDHVLFVMLPKLYEQRLTDLLSANSVLRVSAVKRLHNYYPHFSGEEFGDSMRHIKQFGVGQWRDAFGFSLMQINLELD